MKKTLLLVFLGLLAGFVVNAQTVLYTNDLESWNGNVPVGLSGSKTTFSPDSISQYTVSYHSPVNAVKLVNSTSTHKRFTTQPVTVVNATDYTIEFWVRGQGEIRTGLYDQRSTGSGYATYNPYVVVNSTTWTLVSQIMTCANSTATAEFILSVRNTVAANDHLQVDDIHITYGSGTNPAIEITSPLENATIFGSSVNVNFTVSNFVVGNPGTGIDGHIHYTVDGGSVTMVYNTNPIAVSGLTPGNHTVILQLVDNDHNPLVPNVADTVNFSIDNNPTIVPIHDIEFTTEASGDSPYNGEVVTTGGIVTGKHAAGYFIQAGSGPWTGVYVYDNVNVPNVGDSIIITGLVTEYYNLTEIKTITAFGVISSGNALPAPVIGNCQDINAEQYEGVLLTADLVVCVNPTAGFGMWKIQDSNGDTAKVHNLLYSYAPELQTVYRITGPIYYSFNEFRIEPRGLEDIYVYTGVNELNDNTISVYPNPAKDIVTVSFSREIHALKLIDSFGRIVKEISVDHQSKFEIDVENLPSGLYFIVCDDAELPSVRFIRQ